MPFEHSAGAVVFRREGNLTLYLLLNYPGSSGGVQGYWDFAKGHIEKGEKELDTVKREVQEETGLTDIDIFDGFKEWIKYFFRSGEQYISKIVTFYVAETKTSNVTISFEHTGYIWLPYDEALAKLTFENAKGILRKAHDFVTQKLPGSDRAGG
jgi:bis(5'-nucleosidyl)-tetraphosphatase